MRAFAKGILYAFAFMVFFAAAGTGLFAEERPALCIQGMMSTDEKPVAIINDKVVGVGDEIGGATVEAISDSSVRFNYRGQSVSLSLGEECASGRAGAAATTAGPATRPGAADPSRSNEVAAAAAIAITSVALLVMLALGVVLYIFSAYCLQKIAEKTGNEENKWKAWIPIVNLFLMVEIAGKEWWWVLLMFIPYANIVIFVIIMMGVCEARDKSPWLGLLTLVPAANIFLFAYLAFSSDQAAPVPSPAPAAPTQPPVPQEPPASLPPPYIP